MNTSFQLFQLQEIDSASDNAKNRIIEIDRLISNDESTLRAKAEYDEHVKVLKKMRQQFESLNAELESKKNKKTQSETNLYGGKISNPKELQDLQKEIVYLTASISRMEDELLQKLIDLENSEAKTKLAEEKLKRTLSDFETKKARLIGEKNQLKNMIKVQQEKRKSIIGQIEPDIYTIYEGIRSAKNGIAVAQLIDDACSACGAFLTASQRQQVRSPSKLFYCPSCGRIIYGS